MCREIIPILKQSHLESTNRGPQIVGEKGPLSKQNAFITEDLTSISGYIHLKIILSDTFEFNLSIKSNGKKKEHYPYFRGAETEMQKK